MMQIGNGTYSWSTPIEKLTFWKSEGWVKYDYKTSNSTMLRLYYDQLFIIDNDKILETFNMNSKLRGIYKEDVLILIASGNRQEIRKLKFQILSKSSYYFEKLANHFLVTCHKKATKSDDIIYRNIEDIFRKTIESNDHGGPTTQLPTNYENFVKLCLLDPTFPFVVEETQNIIKLFT
ncbi:unnamed protein product [Chilo suppressalis]|uniref:BTB domain-containing protein n=1 Tax=Chilo suppressalis TaxID=168631 RepID=A0ABN8L8L4_CHISP|nr:unnamed protein product [Chilo suppressalis]